MIYADNAAATKRGRAAIHAMLPCLDGLYGNPSSLCAFDRRAKEALARAVRESAAQLRGTSPVWRDLEGGRTPHMI